MPILPLPPLVPTAWLAERVGRPGLVTLDCSWYLPASGRDARQEYGLGHIPGAQYFDLDEASDPSSPLPHTLPSEATFATYVGSLGVANDSPVVVYDGSGNNLSAARCWWMFRAYGHQGVAVLDGGLRKWLSEGRPIETGEHRAPTVAYHARFDRSRVRSLAQVQAALSGGDAAVVDVRAAGRFAGDEPEPRAGVSSGHMPGAVNLPYTELVHPDGTALSDRDLRDRLAAAGLQLDRPIVATCGSGTSACTLLHALYRLGIDSAALYDGSWTEWASRGMPIATGEA